MPGSVGAGKLGSSTLPYGLSTPGLRVGTSNVKRGIPTCGFSHAAHSRREGRHAGPHGPRVAPVAISDALPKPAGAASAASILGLKAGFMNRPEPSPDPRGRLPCISDLDHHPCSH